MRSVEGERNLDGGGGGGGREERGFGGQTIDLLAGSVSTLIDVAYLARACCGGGLLFSSLSASQVSSVQLSSTWHCS